MAQYTVAKTLVLLQKSEEREEAEAAINARSNYLGGGSGRTGGERILNNTKASHTGTRTGLAAQFTWCRCRMRTIVAGEARSEAEICIFSIHIHTFNSILWTCTVLSSITTHSVHNSYCLKTPRLENHCLYVGDYLLPPYSRIWIHKLAIHKQSALIFYCDLTKTLRH